MSNEATIRMVIECPRWAGLSKGLKNICFAQKIKLEIEVDKGWFRETIRFSATGEEHKIRVLEEVIEEYVEEHSK